MPRKPKPESSLPKPSRNKFTSLGVRPPPRLVDALRALARKNRRTLSAECILAFEAHLRANGEDVPPYGE